VNGTCGGHPFKLGKGGARVCDALAMEVDMASATFALRDWTVTVAGNHVYDRVAGTQHRLDLSFRCGAVGAATAPHGLVTRLSLPADTASTRHSRSPLYLQVGQSFNWPGPRNGRVDLYPAEGFFTTSAQAEGAIEGTAEQYQVTSAHATRFAYSRFDGDPSHHWPPLTAPGGGVSAAAL